MGAVAVDVENDGDLDLFLTHLREETNTLYVNAGGSFADRTTSLGLATPSLRYTGFGVGFADFDRDGRLDLYVANGAVTRNRPPFDPDDPYAEPDQLFRGVEGGGFEEIPDAGLSAPRIETGRGAAFGDLDNDGDVDVVVSDSDSRVRVLWNVVAPGRHWIALDVRRRDGSPALGARVRIEVDGATQWRTVHPASSYASSSDPRAHFGLGGHAEPVRAHVHWPDGTTDAFGPLEVDRIHRVEAARTGAR